MSSVPMSVARAQEVLDGHNCHRARYGLTPLQWDWKLANDAKNHANKCVFEHSSNAERDALGGQGENLAMTTGLVVHADGFYSEEPAYNCGMPIDRAGGYCKSGAQCGHWTALMSDKTTKMGCAVTKCPNMDFLVCRYSPAGNIVGQKPYQNCTPNNSINCSQLSSANFPRPTVPPLPTGAGFPAPSEPTPEQPTVPQPEQPRTTTPQQPSLDDWINQQHRDAAADQQRYYDALAKQQQATQKQEDKGDFLVVNGVEIHYTPQQRSAVRKLSDEDKADLAERLRQIPPFVQPNVISLFLVEKQAPKEKIIAIRGDQRDVLDQLSRQQYVDLYEKVKDFPSQAQHCGVEEYLVSLGLAQPTEYCTQTRQQSNTGVLPAALPPPAQVAEGVKKPKITEQTIVDDKPLARDVPVLSDVYQHPSEQALPFWAWILIGVGAVLVLAAIVGIIVVIVRRVKEKRREQALYKTYYSPTSRYF